MALQVSARAQALYAELEGLRDQPNRQILVTRIWNFDVKPPRIPQRFTHPEGTIVPLTTYLDVVHQTIAGPITENQTHIIQELLFDEPLDFPYNMGLMFSRPIGGVWPELIQDNRLVAALTQMGAMTHISCADDAVLIRPQYLDVIGDEYDDDRCYYGGAGFGVVIEVNVIPN